MTIRALGGALLVEGAEDLLLVKLSMHARVRARRQNGLATLDMGDALAAVEAALALSDKGSPDVPPEPISEDSVQWIGSSHAAAILGCTQRNVRRIARSLDGRRAGRAWVFPEDSVQRYRTHLEESECRRDAS